MTSTSSDVVLEIGEETAVQRALVLGYRALARVARAVPEKTGRALARRAGRLSYRLSSSARSVVAANQSQVLGRPVDDPLVIASTREAFELYARYFVDLTPRVALISALAAVAQAWFTARAYRRP